ncbi:MAG TPA: EamA family transporter [Candidatus Wallbacteria bacterium]|nr:EamA family transporter [Candidatus Wallbacteria bacterium]
MFYILIAVIIILWAAGQSVLKAGLVDSTPVSSAIINGACGLIAGTPFFYFNPPDFTDFWTFFPVCSWIALCYITYYYALNIGDLGAVSSLLNTFPLYTVLFAVMILGEKLILRQWIAVFFIITGGTIISINYVEPLGDESEKNKKDGGKLKKIILGFIVISAAACIGVADAVTMPVVINKGPSTHLVYFWSSQIILGLILKLCFERKKFDFKKLISKYSIIGTFLLNSGGICFVYSMQHGQISIIEPLTSTYTLLVAFIAWKFFGEKFNPAKIAAMTIIIAGIIMILKW